MRCTRRPQAAALATAMTLTVAGCGNDDPNEAATTTTTATATSSSSTSSSTSPVTATGPGTGTGTNTPPLADVLECHAKAGELLVQGEPDTGDAYPWADLISASIDLSDAASIRVTWELGGVPPRPFVSPGGLDKSVLYSVMFGEGSDLSASVQAQLIGDEWHAGVRDWQTSRREQVAGSPTLTETSITFEFPRGLLPSGITGWWPLVEGDGEPDPDFEFELFLLVQDVCPFGESFIVPEDQRLPIALG